MLVGRVSLVVPSLDCQDLSQALSFSLLIRLLDISCTKFCYFGVCSADTIIYDHGLPLPSERRAFAINLPQGSSRNRTRVICPLRDTAGAEISPQSPQATSHFPLEINK